MTKAVADYGDLAGLCGNDGSSWLAALIDAAGHLQIDLVDSGGADLGDLETLLTEIQARLGNESAPASGTVNKQLADILAAAEKIDDLQGALDSVGTDELDVNVESSVLPTGAATSAKQLADGHNVTVDNASLAVTGAFYPGTQPVSAASLPLPSGAATSANQATEITTLQSLQNLVGALHDVGLDELDVQVIASALPSDAATATNQATIITAVEKIDDLRGALDSVGTDELDVNIEESVTLTVQAADGDKLISFESVIAEEVEDTNLSSGTNDLDGTAVSSGKLLRLLGCSVKYFGTVPTVIRVRTIGLASGMVILEQPAPVSGRWYPWIGEVYLEAGDLVRLEVGGATAGDDATLRYTGLQMDAP